jgi:hypothetical protein
MSRLAPIPVLLLTLVLCSYASARSVLGLQDAEMLRMSVAAPTHEGAAHEAGWTNRVVETRVLGAKVRTEVQRNGRDLKGVVRITPPFSPLETYHFTGKIEGDSIMAAHVSGHAFQGRITSDRHVEGILTTRDGFRIPLKVKMP